MTDLSVIALVVSLPVDLSVRLSADSTCMN
jgi:hypothetical protein